MTPQIIALGFIAGALALNAFVAFRKPEARLEACIYIFTTLVWAALLWWGGFWNGLIG